MSPRYVFLALAYSAIVFSLAAAGEPDASSVTEERVALLMEGARSTQAEAWTKIPWTGSLVQARAASKKEGSPVFLFALRGDLAANRC